MNTGPGMWINGYPQDSVCQLRECQSLEKLDCTSAIGMDQIALESCNKYYAEYTIQKRPEKSTSM